MSGRISYYGGIVKDGLVLDLDAAKKDSYAGSGTVWRDISGNGYTGSLVNSPTYTSNNGGSFAFNATNYVNIGNILFTSASNTTIDVWVSFPSMVGSRYVISKGSGGSTYTFILTTGPGGTSGGGSSYIRFSMTNQSGVRSTNVEYGSLLWNQWYNFTFTYNGVNVIGYKNGASPQSTPLTGSLLNTTSPIYLAQDIYSALFSGSISNFKIYNRALSASEVLQNYNATKTRFGL
jgi:hypothetical protein